MKKNITEMFGGLGLWHKGIWGVIGLVLFSYAWEGYFLKPGNPYYVVVLIGALAAILVFFYYYNVLNSGEYYIFEYGTFSIKNIYVVIGFLFLLLIFGLYFLFLGNWMGALAVICPVFLGVIGFKYGNIKVKRVSAEKNIVKKCDKKHTAIYLLCSVLLIGLVQFFWSAGLIIPAFFCLFFLAVLAGAFFNNVQFTDDKAKKYFSRPEIIALIVIAAAAVFLRFYKIGELPPGFDNDARTIFDYIITLINKGRGEGFANKSGMYFTQVFMKVFGFDLMNQRILEVSLSVVSLVFFFLLVRELYGKQIAIPAVMFFGVLFICVSMSRTDIMVYRTVLYLNAGIYFLVRAVRTGRLWMFFIAAFMITLNLYAYHAGKMHLPIAGIVFLAMTFDVLKIRGSVKNLFVFVGVLILVVFMFLPQLIVIVKDAGAYFAYSKGFQLKGSGLNLLPELLRQFMVVAGAFTVKGTEHFTTVLPGREILAGPEKMFFIAGLAYLLYGFKQRVNIIIIFWMLMGIFPLVYYPYVFELYYYRMVLVFPAMAVVLALGFNVFYRYISFLIPKYKSKIYILMLLAVFLFSFQNAFKDYFVSFSENNRVRDRYHSINFELEKIMLNNADDKRILVSEYFIKDTHSFYFGKRAVDEKGKRIFEVMDISGIKISDFYGAKKDILIIAEGLYADYFGYLEEYFPDTRIEAKPNIRGETRYVDPAAPEYRYVTVFIPRENIDAAFGLDARVYRGTEVAERFVSPDEKKRWVTGDKITLSGVIEIPENTAYVFDMETKEISVLKINGKVYKGEKLPAGSHKIELILSDLNGTMPDLYWNYRGERNKIDARNLSREKELFGMKMTIECFVESDIDYEKIEPTMVSRLYWFNPGLICRESGGRYSMSWDGYYFADKKGFYRFEIDSYDGFCNEVSVNNDIVFVKAGYEQRGGVLLEKGWNRIKILSQAFVDKPDAGVFYYRLKAKPPNKEEFEVVEYKKLKPYNPSE